MIWTSDVEAKVDALLTRAFTAASSEIVNECARGLMKLGLTKRQVENGLIAGGMQIALDSGLTEETARNFNEFCVKYPEDGAIIVKNLIA